MGCSSDFSVGSQCYVLRAGTVDAWWWEWELSSELQGSTIPLASHRAAYQDEHLSTGTMTKHGKSKAACLTQCPKTRIRVFQEIELGILQSCLMSIPVPNRFSLWLWWFLSFSLELRGRKEIQGFGCLPFTLGFHRTQTEHNPSKSEMAMRYQVISYPVR